MEYRTGKSYGKYFGAIPVIGSLFMAIGYSVVVGWIMRYFIKSIFKSNIDFNISNYFSEISSGSSNWLFHILALLLTFIIMLGGISKGIEKANKIMMPIFFILFVILAINMIFLPNSLNGYLYLFKPNLNSFKDLKMWAVALGQAFFSLSIFGAGLIIYGSYAKKSTNILSCAKNISFYTVVASILSALVVIPAVFAFNLQDEISCGPPLMFITMPMVFNNMPFGWLAQILFFTAVLFAAITSLINLFEVPVEAIQSQFNLSRPVSILIILIISIVIGVAVEDSAFIGKWMDFLSVYIIPLEALLAGFMFFWVYGKDFARKEVQQGNDKKLGKWFEPMTRYVFIGITLAVFILGIFGKL